MANKKLREKYENEYLEKYGQEEFERRFKKLLKRNKIANTIIASFLSIALANASLIGVQFAKSLDFNEEEYSQNLCYEPGELNKRPIVVFIENNDFSSKEISLIHQAISELDNVMTGAKFEIAKSHTIKTNIYISKQKLSKTFGINQIAGTATTYKTSKIFGFVAIDPSSFYMKSNAKTIITHEIMHCLGMEHSKDINSVMYPFAFCQKLTKEDINNLNKLYPLISFEDAINLTGVNQLNEQNKEDLLDLEK